MAAIESAIQRQVDYVVGKPHLPILEFAVGMCGVALENSMIVGDSIESDMGLAARAGIPGALIIGGKHISESESKQFSTFRSLQAFSESLI